MLAQRAPPPAVDMQIATRYTRTAMLLHWLIALLILINVALGLITEQLPDDWIRPVIDTHKSIGITVLGLAIMRLLWRLTHRPPALPVGYSRHERISAHLVHAALYVLIFALPISGWLHDSAWKAAPEVPMHWFGLFEWPRIGYILQLEPVSKERLHDLLGEIHEWFGFVLYGLFALHVGGALKHQFIDRHAELQRMLS